MGVSSTAEMPATEARERLVEFVEQVVAELPHPRQRENALLYVRGLVEYGGRKSLQPTLFRLGEDAARYESLQQFLADSPWDPTLLVRACAERVAPELAVSGWIVDDTGVAKDGRHSPGVKRQYSGTLGKIGNCQITVSVHAVAQAGGSLPLGWALYLPEEWCADAERRGRAKIPAEVEFRTKPQLARALCEQAAGWHLPAAPILADQAYGDDTAFRRGLQAEGLEYVVAVSPQLGVFPAETVFALPEGKGRGRPPSVPRPDRKPESVRALALGLPAAAWQRLACRRTPAGEEVSSRFACVRVAAAHAVVSDHQPPRQEWLVLEWPEGEEAPCDYWLSNLPADTSPERLARLARLRWAVELDYRQLKGELGLDHYEGRSYLGFHHHCALVTCAHAFLTLERLCPKVLRPA